MTLIKTEPTLAEEHATAAWTVYRECFAPLRHLAVQRHLMTIDEFDQQMADPRLTKAMMLDDHGTIIGIACYTTDLAAVQLVEPAYFEHHYTRAYRGQHIWYVTFCGVLPAHHGAFLTFVEHMYNLSAPHDGVVLFDACNHNVNKLRIFRSIIAWTARLSGRKSKAKVIDQESYLLVSVAGGHL